VAHTCNLSYSGSRDQEDHSWKPAEQIVCKTLSWKNPLHTHTHTHTMGWWSGSRCMPWVQTPVLLKKTTTKDWWEEWLVSHVCLCLITVPSHRGKGHSKLTYQITACIHWGGGVFIHSFIHSSHIYQSFNKWRP
jgi:hypothetical protein